MKISGFTFMRNTSTLYYPFLESIQSILSIVDEFVIALGDNSTDDQTEIQLKSITSPKIKIIHTKWDLDKYQRGTIYAQQTDVAKQHCTGDWLFYLQSDEVLHEKYHKIIYEACKTYLDDRRVEGFIFNYKHFWGDYNHFLRSHAWYPYEIRMIRNLPDIHSYGDAQSFKWINEFDGLDYRTKKHTRRLNVILLDAFIYHYGWVRPPSMMQIKSKQMDLYYHSEETVKASYQLKDPLFDYGNLHNLELFTEDHPVVMRNFIAGFHWKEQLNYLKKYKPKRSLLKHEKLKYRLLSWVENKLLSGRQLFGYKNWKVIN